MRKFIILIFSLLLGYSFVCAEQAWVDNVNANGDHVTYSDNLVLPTEQGVIFLTMRKDYVCSQNKYAILWVKGYRNEDLSNPIDLSFMIDKDKLRKYTLAEPQDYAVNIVRQYCE